MSTATTATASITVKTADLQRALAFVARFADKGSTLPIYQTVLLESNASILTLTATDLEVFGRIGIAGIDDNPRSFVARKLTGNFPDYQCVMGPLPHSGIIPDAAALLVPLRRVGQLADSRSRCVHFSLGSNTLGLRAETSETGIASDELPIRWTGPTINFGLNARYLKHFLELSSGEVELRAESPHKAFEFSVPGWTYRIMPMRT